MIVECWAMSLRITLVRFLVLSSAALAAGCSSAAKPPKAPQPYVDEGYKPDIPVYMKGTIYERTELANTAGYPVSGYSLVVNLQNTGDNSSIPTLVRQIMIKKMALAGFGEHDDPRFTNFQ